VEHTALGRAGLQVSRLCLGTMIFGTQVGEQEAFGVLDRALELGIDFVDTADAYPVPSSPETAGRTEEIVGRWLRTRREPVVVATKCVARTGPGPNDAGSSRKHVIEACEASLRRLRLDRVDVFYLHQAQPPVPMEETAEALDRLLQDGKIHYVGASNFEAWQLGLLLLLASERRLALPAVLQPRYNLLSRNAERDLLPLCRALGVGVVPYNPLGAGVLAGRYRRGDEVPEDSRLGQGPYGRVYQARYLREGMFDVADEVAAIASERGVTPAAVAVAWLLAQPGVTAPIVGASRPQQLEDSARAVDLQLGQPELDRLDRVSQPYT
jgi:aryl-alcohol dehydrogenase (NADP+)